MCIVFPSLFPLPPRPLPLPTSLPSPHTHPYTHLSFFSSSPGRGSTSPGPRSPRAPPPPQTCPDAPVFREIGGIGVVWFTRTCLMEVGVDGWGRAVVVDGGWGEREARRRGEKEEERGRSMHIHTHTYTPRPSIKHQASSKQPNPHLLHHRSLLLRRLALLHLLPSLLLPLQLLLQGRRVGQPQHRGGRGRGTGARDRGLGGCLLSMMLMVCMWVWVAGWRGRQAGTPQGGGRERRAGRCRRRAAES